MANETEVIQQFLVSLGFQVDQTGLKKFLGGLNTTTSAAMGAGKAVLGVAVAAEAMVVQFASSMEKLYYQSKRTDATVESLQGLEFGSRKIGLAAGVARDALESMVSAARMNPGLRGLIDGMLGKNTEGLDQAQVMIELVQKLSTLPHFQGAQFAQMFGMDEKTFLMLKQGLPELIKAEQEHADLLKNAGVNATAAAKASVEYSNSIRDITARVGILRDKIAVSLLEPFREFNHLVVSVLDDLAKIRSPATAAEGAKVYQDDAAAGHMATPKKAGGGIRNWLLSFAKGNPRYDDAAKSMPLGLRQNNPGNLRSWGGAPVQNGFVRFGSSADGLSAMAGNLLAYYDKRGLHNVRDIIARWAPANDNNNTGAYVDQVAKRLHVGATDTLNLKDPAVLSRLMGAMIQQEQGYNPFGSTELLAAAQSRLGGGERVVMHQKTDIHVAGGANAAETGRSVAAAQREVNSAMVRNLQGAVQ